MKAPNYQVDLVRDVRPSTADVSGLAQATANEMAAAGAARAGIVKAVGGTIWDAYKGKESADFEKKLEAERQGFVKPLEDAGKGLLAAQETKKQGMLFAAQTAQKLFDESIGSDLEGRDTELIKQQVGEMYAKTTTPILKEYEQKMKAYEEVLSSFPARQSEMMARSESLLKQYIARMPALADEFRQTTQRILGVQGIESFTTMQAYKAVEQFSSQQVEAAKAAKKAAADEDARALKAYTDANKAMGVDEFTSLQQWQDPVIRSTMGNILRENSQLRLRISKEETELKAGNLNLSTFVSTRLGAEEAAMAAALPAMYNELKQTGLGEADILGGNLSLEQLRNPKIMGVLSKYADQATMRINQTADNMRADIGTRVAKGEIRVGDVEYTRSMENIEKWRKNHLENTIGTKGTGLLNALELYSKRDEVSLQNARQFTEMSGNLLKLIDPEGYLQKQVARATPEALAKLVKDHPSAALVQTIMGRVSEGLDSPAKSFEVIKELSDKVASQPNFRNSATPSNKAANPEAAAMNVITYEAAAKAVKLAASDPTVPIDAYNMDAVKKIINGAASDAEYGTTFFKRHFSDLQAVIQRASPADKEIIKQQVLTASTSSIYGMAGHGEALSKFLGDLKTYNVADKVSFVDTTGTSELKFSVQPKVIATRGSGGAKEPPVETYESIVNKQRSQNQQKKINAALTHVDNALRVRAQLNDESIIKLRQDFMQQVDTAYKRGIPLSQVVAETLEGGRKPSGTGAPAPAAGAATPVSGGTTSQVNKWWLE
jgi:hypothetical protein